MCQSHKIAKMCLQPLIAPHGEQGKMFFYTDELLYSSKYSILYDESSRRFLVIVILFLMCTYVSSLHIFMYIQYVHPTPSKKSSRDLPEVGSVQNSAWTSHALSVYYFSGSSGEFFLRKMLLKKGNQELSI